MFHIKNLYISISRCSSLIYVCGSTEERQYHVIFIIRIKKLNSKFDDGWLCALSFVLWWRQTAEFLSAEFVYRKKKSDGELNVPEQDVLLFLTSSNALEQDY